LVGRQKTSTYRRFRPGLFFFCGTITTGHVARISTPWVVVPTSKS